MARPLRIEPFVVTAATATSLETLRQCQAVLLPALFGESLGADTKAADEVSSALIEKVKQSCELKYAHENPEAVIHIERFCAPTARRIRSSNTRTRRTKCSPS